MEQFTVGVTTKDFTTSDPYLAALFVLYGQPYYGSYYDRGRKNFIFDADEIAPIYEAWTKDLVKVNPRAYRETCIRIHAEIAQEKREQRCVISPNT